MLPVDSRRHCERACPIGAGTFDYAQYKLKRAAIFILILSNRRRRPERSRRIYADKRGILVNLQTLNSPF